MGSLRKTNKPRRKFHHITGTYVDMEGRSFKMKSKMERNVARILDFQKQHGQIITWFYEDKEWCFDNIKRGNRFYKCDFHIIERHQEYYWEVKGYMDKASRTKLKRMKKYYPEVRIILIDQKMYLALKKPLEILLKFE